jgi:hypothetical protein
VFGLLDGSAVFTLPVVVFVTWTGTMRVINDVLTVVCLVDDKVLVAGDFSDLEAVSVDCDYRVGAIICQIGLSL